MHRGFTKAYRKEIDSDIWDMPPVYHRVFYWLRQRAIWTDKLIPNKEGLGTWLSPGSLITSVQTIADGVSYYERGAQKTPNKKTILEVLNWLEKTGSITRLSNRRGSMIYLNNWHTYNSENEPDKRTTYHDAYQGSYHDTYQGSYPYKEVKEVKNIIEKVLEEKLKGLALSPENKTERPKGPPVQIDREREFMRIWDRYPMKDGRIEAEQSFNNTVRTLEDVKSIHKALDNYLRHLKKKENSYKSPKAGKTWFAGWHDWLVWVEPITTEDQRENAVKREELEQLLKRVESDIDIFENIAVNSPQYKSYKDQLPGAMQYKARLINDIETLEKAVAL
jgi:hypothetical protein